MPVYVMYRPTLRQAALWPMERFNSVERAACALRDRTRTKEGRSWYVGEARPGPGAPSTSFPDADLSGYFMVWRRPAREPAPVAGERPEERWTLSERGAVVQGPWDVPEGTDPADLLPYTRPSYSHDDTVALIEAIIASGHERTADLARELIASTTGPTYLILKDLLAQARINLTRS